MQDYATLVTDIIMKKESGYFTHIAFIVPTSRLRSSRFIHNPLRIDTKFIST